MHAASQHAELAPAEPSRTLIISYHLRTQPSCRYISYDSSSSYSCPPPLPHLDRFIFPLHWAEDCSSARSISGSGESPVAISPDLFSKDNNIPASLTLSARFHSGVVSLEVHRALVRAALGVSSDGYTLVYSLIHLYTSRRFRSTTGRLLSAVQRQRLSSAAEDFLQALGRTVLYLLRSGSGYRLWWLRFLFARALLCSLPLGAGFDLRILEIETAPELSGVGPTSRNHFGNECPIRESMEFVRGILGTLFVFILLTRWRSCVLVTKKF